MLAPYQTFAANIYTTRARMKIDFEACAVMSTLGHLRPKAIAHFPSDGEQPFAGACALHGARD
jgi:hypothetical protein